MSVPKNVKKGKRGSSKKPNALPKSAVARFNELLDERMANYDGPDCVAIGAIIALHTGMRAEEVCGLRWSDVDFATERIHVVNVIERANVPVLDEGGNRTYDEHGLVTKYSEFDSSPKTDESKRFVHMDFELLKTLITHKKYMTRALDELYPKKDRPCFNDIYVIGSINGKHYSPHRLGVNFRKWTTRKNIVGTEGAIISFHDLRHSFATLAIQAGQPLSEVSAILGHSKPTTTLNIYVGDDDEEQKRVIDGMSGILSARKPTDNSKDEKTGTEG